MRIASSAAVAAGSLDPATAVAVMIAIVDVTLTLSGRELPSSAYTTISTSAAYRPSCTGSPASDA